ncbi:MAG: extracellular solute-binding protein [Bifidobacteriaceae bacterium]|jgi:raffinose/stachyose/melibiose transport system substrate-binding protein|nr:extracellular solute-binding protein [Bifidobacteriaceae bacterium]
MKKNTPRMLLAAIGVVATASLVVSCSPSDQGAEEDTGSTTSESAGDAGTTDEDQAAGGDAVSITIAMMNGGKPGLDAVIAAFEEANPSINIEASYYESGDSFNSAVITQFASGNGTDIVYVIGGQAAPVSVRPFAEAGYLMDLSDQPWVAGMYEGTKDLYTVDGKVLGYEVGLSPLALLNYNRDIFAELGVEVPQTFDELLGVCGTISENSDVVPISFAAGLPAVDANNTAVIAGNTVTSLDPDWLDKRYADEVTFVGDPGWTRALEQIVEMIDGGCFSAGTAALQMPEMISEFANAEAAMMFTYGGQNGRVKAESPDLNIGMFPFPADAKEDTRLTPQSAGGMGIWTGSTHQEEAKQFLEYLASPESSDTYSDLNYLLSGQQAATAEMPESYKDLTTVFEEGLIVPDQVALWPSPSMRDIVGASIQGLFTNQKTVEEVLQDFDNAWEES